MKTNIISILLLPMLLAAGCAKEEHRNAQAVLRVETAPLTKTAVNGKDIVFLKGDELGVYAEGVSTIRLSNANTASTDKFEGYFVRRNVKKESVRYFGVYPYSGKMDGNSMLGNLSSIQAAPFDLSANLMVSTPVAAAYDEDNMPALSLVFRQALALLKITVINTDPAFEDEKIHEVVFSCANNITGSYVLDLTGESGIAFTGAEASMSKRVVSRFETPVTVGLNVPHDFYIFVNPVSLSGTELKVLTDRNKFSVKGTKNIAVAAGRMISLPVFDIAGMTKKEAPVKVIACWGDSYTNREKSTPNSNDCNYAYHLQKMLGREYKIFNGGIAGDKTVSIAARQGAVQVYTGAEFTLPADTSPIVVDGLFLNMDWQGLNVPWYRVPVDWQDHYSFVNPCTINGIECRVTYNSIRRVSPGAAVTIPAHTEIITYGAANFKSADLTIIYMGQNGTWGGDFGKLVTQYKHMINFLDKPEDYLALGFHNSRHNDEYRTLYENNFGRRFVNLHTGVIDRYEEMLVATGAYQSRAEISAIDREFASTDQWPQSFWYAPEDIHPSRFGGHAIAILIYERMRELGYLD